MPKALDLQTFGAVLVISAVIAAESAAWWLAASPGSAFAWSVNMSVFHVFEYARAEPSPLRFLFAPATTPIAALALVLVLAARLLRLRLAVALAANLSFAFTIALAYAATSRMPGTETASLLPIALRPDASGLVALMLAGSFIAFSASHASFLKAIMSERALKRS
jgi:hypothetical protein